MGYGIKCTCAGCGKIFYGLSLFDAHLDSDGLCPDQNPVILRQKREIIESGRKKKK